MLFKNRMPRAVSGKRARLYKPSCRRPHRLSMVARTSRDARDTTTYRRAAWLVPRKKRARVLDEGVVYVECRNSGADPVDEASYHAASLQSRKSSSPQCLSGSWSTAFDNLHITAWAQRHRRHRLDRRTGAKLRR